MTDDSSKARSHLDMHRALETTTSDYVGRVSQGSDDYAALLRRLEAAHRVVPTRSSDGRSRSRVQIVPAPAKLPHMLNAVDSTLDGMIQRLELELLHRTPDPPPSPHDASATALSAQLRRVLASSRVQVERGLLACALREAESDTSAVVRRRKSLSPRTFSPWCTPRGCAHTRLSSVV